MWSGRRRCEHITLRHISFFFFSFRDFLPFFFCLMIFQHLKTLKCFYLQKKNSSEVKFNNNLQCFYSCWNCKTRPGPKYMNENVKSSTAARWRCDMFVLNYISVSLMTFLLSSQWMKYTVSNTRVVSHTDDLTFSVLDWPPQVPDFNIIKSQCVADWKTFGSGSDPLQSGPCDM